MDILNVTKNFTGLIKKAGNADENELKLLRNGGGDGRRYS